MTTNPLTTPAVEDSKASLRLPLESRENLLSKILCFQLCLLLLSPGRHKVRGRADSVLRRSHFARPYCKFSEAQIYICMFSLLFHFQYCHYCHYCLLPTVYCLLSTAYCLLSTVYCLLSASCWLSPGYWHPSCPTLSIWLLARNILDIQKIVKNN